MKKIIIIYMILGLMMGLPAYASAEAVIDSQNTAVCTVNPNALNRDVNTETDEPENINPIASGDTERTKEYIRKNMPALIRVYPAKDGSGYILALDPLLSPSEAGLAYIIETENYHGLMVDKYDKELVAAWLSEAPRSVYNYGGMYVIKIEPTPEEYKRLGRPETALMNIERRAEKGVKLASSCGVKAK